MASLGKWLVLAGLVLVAVGLLVWLGAGRSWWGRLPGDFEFSRGHSTFRFPLATSLVVSLVLTVVLNLILWFFRR